MDSVIFSNCDKCNLNNAILIKHYIHCKNKLLNIINEKYKDNEDFIKNDYDKLFLNFKNFDNLFFIKHNVYKMCCISHIRQY